MARTGGPAKPPSGKIGKAVGLPAVPLDSFVGRERELGELGDLLARERLVTVFGAAGAGKTRLTAELVRRRAAQGGVDVWWVELVRATTADSLVPTVAAAARVRERPGVDPAESLARALDGRPVLLGLDNCEHVVDACASLVTFLLGRCPELRIVATSREALRVAGEVTYRLGELSLPQDGGLSGAEALLRSEAVRLFVARARECVPGFALTEAVAPVVAQICVRLDGLPLAIELAARRVRMWPVTDLLDLLADRFDVLTVAPRHASSRHRSLSALIDGSYRLLSPAERLLLQRASVMVGGFDLAGLVAVCADARLPAPEILPALTGLEEKSLVVGASGDPGRGRFRQLETIRLYGWRRLTASGEAEQWLGRLTSWLAGVAERALDTVLPAPDLVARLDDEHDNLVHAVEWAAAAEDERHVLLAAALARGWRQRGQVAAARAVLRRALSAAAGRPHTAGGAPVRHLAEALGQGAVLAFLQADHAGAVALGEQALRIGRRLDDPIMLIRGLFVLTVGRLSGDDPGSARQYLQECTRLVRALAEPFSRAVFLHNLAWCRLQVGDVDEAATLLGMALPVYLERADGHRRGDALHTLGALSVIRGDLTRAEAHFTQALELASPPTAPSCMEGQALVAARQGRHEQALRLFTAASRLREASQTEPEPWWRRLVDEALGQSRRAVGSRPRVTLDGPDALVADAGPAAGPPEDPGDPLTARERHVAGLVADGLTNRQIAGRLGLSARTVDAHLDRIRRKLAVTSRAQIAVWSARRGDEPGR